MFVVISDLHFEEESKDQLINKGSNHSVIFIRNFPASAFRKFISELADIVVKNNAERLDLVFAGDVFDMHRTQYWMETSLRPYKNNDDIAKDEALETYIIQIFQAICTESNVKESLEVIKNLAQGLYKPDPDRLDFIEPFPLNKDMIELHLLTGNHDRILNATEKIRKIVCDTFNITKLDYIKKGFPHYILSENPRLLIRHGHEYDPFNFGYDYTKSKMISLVVPDQYYNSETFGDFTTIDVACRLPFIFRKQHSELEILENDDLRRIYLRFLEFDDVRPQSALIPFLTNIPDCKLDSKAIWVIVLPVLQELLNYVSKQKYFSVGLKKLKKQNGFFLTWIYLIVLKSRIWRLGIPFKLALFISKLMNSSSGVGPQNYARLEETIINKKNRFLVAGHTHNPQVANISQLQEFDQYYTDTGTWRNSILVNNNQNSFASLKAITYVIFYRFSEDNNKSDKSKSESFDYWTGFTQNWK